MDVTLVVHPKVTFAQLGVALARLGWTRGRDALAAPPIIPDEPEFASWSARGRDAQISYTFNPVVHLRVLVFYGERADTHRSEVDRAIPTLGIEELPELLHSADARTALLGILAAREMRAFTLLNLVEPLRVHREPAVARAAENACEELLRQALEIGAAHLHKEQQRHPERSVLFPHLGNAHIRRQTLRWLIHDYRGANEHITAVLRSGLVDEDWEVRATAMLAAARLGARELGSAVRRIEIPRTTRSGPDLADGSLLFDLRQAVLEHLEGKPLPELTKDQVSGSSTSSLASRDDVLWHLRRCVAGLPTDRHDRILLLVHALTQPLDVEGPAPELPPSIVEEQGEYRLKRSGILLRWIAPIPHWLGADDEDLPVPNPIRQVTPPSGFFIVQHPLTVATAQWIDSGGRQDDSGATNSLAAIYPCRWPEALRVCERLSQLEALPITLPTADQWEMAARGTDGRRYPWGNGFEGDPNTFASPWGVEKQIGGKPEWTYTAMHSGEHIICGGGEDLRCASRANVLADNPNALFAVRPVISWVAR
jgi:hypothetical protein